MKNLILFLLCLLSFTHCTTKDNESSLTEKDTLKDDCKREVEASIEIWNHTGKDYIIGDWDTREDKYVKSGGWDKDNYPYPKKFDVKVNVQNNLLAYEQEKPNKIEDYTLNIILKIRVGHSPDALYPLNSKICESIEIVNDRIIKHEDFINQPADRNHYIEIWKKDISFEELYRKYESQELFINQFIFEITLTDKMENICNYEYVFPMLERGEP